MAGASLLALAVTLGLLAAVPSRFLRGRLRFSAYLFVAAFALDMAAAWQTGAVDAIRSIARLFTVLGVINLLVAMLVNPWREHRASDRFPAIAQDVGIIAIFVVVATVLLRDRLLTTSAVGAVIVGFALQDTIGNFFAGLAIQVEKPFRIGQWIAVADREGQVTEITWRATKLRTEAGQLLVVPNAIIAKDPILNYSEPSIPTRIEVEVGVAYQTPPNVVKAAIRDALAQAPLVLATPPAEVLITDFAASSVVYRIRFWIDDYEQNEPARDQVRSAIWYGFARREIEIPYPIQVEMSREEPGGRTEEVVAASADHLAKIDLFGVLSDNERLALARACPERPYAQGEAIVRQGDAGDSMFIVVDGSVRVSLEPYDEELASIGAGGFFGEMSMLTGEARTATVRASEDVVLMEVPASEFRAIAEARPALLEQVAAVIAVRQAGLAGARESAASSNRAPLTARRSVLGRIQRFLRLQ